MKFNFKPVVNTAYLKSIGMVNEEDRRKKLEYIPMYILGRKYDTEKNTKK